jgi:hypothetical protein
MSRLEPIEAREFINDLVRFMHRRSIEIVTGESLQEGESDGDSVQKEYYGDQWLLVYGIQSGIEEMWLSNTPTEDYGIKGDSNWQEHYDEYGYGAYGDGLEIGKKLAFFEDRNFEFSTSEPEFDICERHE